MGGTYRGFRIVGLAAMSLLCGLSHAGHYQLRAGQNPTGGLVTYSTGWFQYTGGNGAYENDPEFVTCEGMITTIYDWKPNQIENPNAPGTLMDDPLDLPPDEVIVQETCWVSISAFYFLGGIAFGDCSNELGFDTTYTFEEEYMEQNGVPVLMGYTETATSKGTLYTRRAGGPTVTVERSPWAWVTVANGLCDASVQYSSQVIAPQVNLVGTTRFHDPEPALKFLTGQRINSSLSVLINPKPNAVDLTVNPTSYNWWFEDSGDQWDSFKDYLHSGSLGRLDELARSDKDDPQFNFYTNEDGTTRVKCEFRFQVPSGAMYVGGPPENPLGFTAFSRVVSSVRPGFGSWDIDDGLVFLYPSGNPTQFGFGPGNGTSNGQEWSNVDYDVPAGFGSMGHLGAFCQLINADRHLYRTVNPPGGFTHFIKDPYNATQALDKSMPYFTGTWDAFSALGTGYDSPSQPLSYSVPNTNTWYLSTADDTFETWAMYRPPSKDGQPTTWIPMGYYTWYWRGTATLEPSGWVLSNAAGANNNGGYGIESKVHPTWNKISPSPFGFIGVPN